jgi:hypothetical protein
MDNTSASNRFFFPVQAIKDKSVQQICTMLAQTLDKHPAHHFSVAHDFFAILNEINHPAIVQAAINHLRTRMPTGQASKDSLNHFARVALRHFEGERSEIGRAVKIISCAALCQLAEAEIARPGGYLRAAEALAPVLESIGALKDGPAIVRHETGAIVISPFAVGRAGRKYAEYVGYGFDQADWREVCKVNRQNFVLSGSGDNNYTAEKNTARIRDRVAHHATRELDLNSAHDLPQAEVEGIERFAATLKAHLADPALRKGHLTLENYIQGIRRQLRQLRAEL